MYLVCVYTCECSRMDMSMFVSESVSVCVGMCVHACE